MATTQPKEILVNESTVTSRGQTTIPSPIRKALNLQPSDKIRFVLRADNSVVISRGEPESEHEDPMIGAFLDFLARDAHANPHTITTIPQDLLEESRSLTKGIKVDLEAPLDPDDE